MCAQKLVYTSQPIEHESPTGKALGKLTPLLKTAIVRALHKACDTFRDLQWLKLVGNLEDFVKALVSCTDEFEDATAAVFGMLTEEKKHQMLALRGLLGHGVLEHCLQKRYRVDYGTAERCESTTC